MYIAFATMGLKFSGDSLERGALGGSETALLCLAREFAKRGHDVTVFCECDKPGQFDGVNYYHHSSFAKQAALVGWDVLIVSRWPEFLTTRSFAGLRILWLHDLLTDHSRFLSQCWQTDRLFLLSDYHISSYTEGKNEHETKEKKLPQFKEWMWKTSNGVDAEFVADNTRDKVPGKVIYTSRPERGLHYLLQIMPQIWQERPDVKLHFANYSLQGMQVPDHVRQVHALCDQFVKQYNAAGPRVINMGHLAKDQLYQEISSAELFLYPTDFGEISCISAMEAAECGTPIISTNDFALKETVANGRTGYLINGHPSEEEYQAKFVRKALYLLSNQEPRERMSASGPLWNRERGYHWDLVAASWEAKFRELMQMRWNRNKVEIVEELTRQSDLVMAREIAEKEGLVSQAQEINSIISTAQYGAEEPDTPTVAKEIADSTFARFSKTAELLAVRGLDPSKIGTVWDFASGRFAFALTAAKFFPNAESVAFDEDAAVLANVRRYAEEANILDKVTTVIATTLTDPSVKATAENYGRPDLIFLGGVVELQEHPETLIQDALNIVKPGGWVVINSAYGPRANRLRDVEHQRLWNLSMFDYRELLMDKFAGHTTFFREPFNQSGDMVGWWIVAIPVPDEEDKKPTTAPIVSEHRKFFTRPYQSVVCCMIAKDAEEWIVKCLKHLRPFVDRISITLDNRTTDRTQALVDHMVDEWRVEEFEDFAQFRNVSRDGHGERWVLWIDTDEMLIDGEKLSKYLHSDLYEGFALRQCHLQLDVQGSEDHPVRLLRNRPHYRFVGCIHEHCEDTSRGIDCTIEPAVPIPDVPLAHYGYQNEFQRRNKCSHRNMELLQKDLRVNPTRQMNKVLLMRDYLNIIKWSVEAQQLKGGAPFLQRGSREHMMAEAAITTYLKFLADPMVNYHKLAFPMYQEALTMLSVSGLPFADRDAPPFCIRLIFQASIGKAPDPGAVDPNAPTNRWFIDRTEFLDFMEKQSKSLLAGLGHMDRDQFEQEVAVPPTLDYVYDEKAMELLEVGTAAIQPMTGRLLK